MRWWTADLHFGHTNICSYTGRPYENVDEMNEDLIRRWNQKVAPVDEVYVLGDIVMGKIDQTLNLVTELHGKKVLVPGNHDRCWRGNLSKKHCDTSTNWAERYEDVGLNIVEGPFEFDLAGVKVLVDHFPYRGDSRDEERFVEHRPVDAGLWLLHGHVHEKWRVMDKMINVGVDAWGGYPVSELELIELIGHELQNCVPLSWS